MSNNFKFQNKVSYLRNEMYILNTGKMREIALNLMIKVLFDFVIN